MMNREISKTVYTKEGRNWEKTFTTTDKAEIYESLALDMINKKIHACTFIKSIKRTPNYDGTQTITVNYNNDCKAVYIIADH